MHQIFLRVVYVAGDPKSFSLREHPPWFRTSFDDPVTYMSRPGLGYGNTAATVGGQYQKKIKLNAKVTGINYANEHMSVISFTKNGVSHQVSAKTVLVTVSLGVLKAGTIQFTPRLPAWKQERIDAMGFSVMNKCAMQWNDESAVVWPEDEWMELITQDDESSAEWTIFMNPTKYKGGKPTIVAWIGGEEAHRMESQTDEVVLDNVMKNFRLMFPSVTHPDRFIITRWGQDENIRGTYSSKVPGRDFYEDASYLQQSIGNSLYFAGEATAGQWYATVIGAWETGQEAAGGMMSALRNWKPPSPPDNESVGLSGLGSSGANFNRNLWLVSSVAIFLGYILQ